MPRILYLQYTNPAGYPPLLHSATLLAEQGWEVLLTGISAQGTASFELPRNQRITYRQIAGQSGGRLGALHYGYFHLGVSSAALRFRPHWCYASDAHSASAALMLRQLTGARVLYHEHDAPGPDTRAVVLAARERLARSADIIVAPSADRLALLPAGDNPRYVVWNCPRLGEVSAGAVPRATETFRLVYHGSLSRERLTPAFIDALQQLPGHVELNIYGFATAGHHEYAGELQLRAERAGVSARVHYHGAVPARADLLRALDGHQLGIATISAHSDDQNQRTLLGASNKAFEYLARGVAILVTDLAEWRATFVEPGYAVACNPHDAASIAAAIRPLVEQPADAQRMGMSGRTRVLQDWNYERQFAPVMAALRA